MFWGVKHMVHHVDPQFWDGSRQQVTANNQLFPPKKTKIVSIFPNISLNLFFRLGPVPAVAGDRFPVTRK